MKLLDRIPFLRSSEGSGNSDTKQHPASPSPAPCSISNQRPRARRVPERATAPRSILSAENTGRLESTWGTTPQEIDAFIYAHWNKLVARSREMARTSDHAKKFIQLCRDNIAGPTGFTLQPQITADDDKPDKAAADAIVDAWALWSKKKNHTVTGTMSRSALERLAVTDLATTGEFILRVRRGASAGPWGFSVQVIDPVRLDPTHVEQFGDGRFIKHGIEFDHDGRPLRYHFRKEPPGAWLWGTTHSGFERVIIPASEIIHIFLAEHDNQKRGLPPMMTALARMRVLQNYEDAALVAADIGARKNGFFRNPDEDSDEISDEDLPMDAEAGVYENIGNREFIPNNPQYPSGDYGPFVTSALRAISSGLCVSYNNLASDLTGVNFSSIRQGALDEREMWKGLQQVFIDNLSDPVFEAWLEYSLLAGKIKAKGKPLKAANLEKYLSCIFVGRRWGWIDPAAEMAAAEKALALKLRSRSSIIRDYGSEPWSTWNETAADNADMKALGLDPGVVIAGATNTQPTTGDKDKADDDESKGKDADDDENNDDKKPAEKAPSPPPPPPAEEEDENHRSTTRRCDRHRSRRYDCAQGRSRRATRSRRHHRARRDHQRYQSYSGAEKRYPRDSLRSLRGGCGKARRPVIIFLRIYSSRIKPRRAKPGFFRARISDPLVSRTPRTRPNRRTHAKVAACPRQSPPPNHIRHGRTRACARRTCLAPSPRRSSLADRFPHGLCNPCVVVLPIPPRYPRKTSPT
ncbi:phage portal protein [Opitutaceae bacterium TAV4]|nr:phage portal protein [Opitutaceae bacterium TAV4]